FVGKTLLHGDVLMWLMKTLLTSGCTNQRGAGHIYAILTGELRTVEVGSKDVQIRQLHTILKKKIKIILQKLNIIQ
ncbi:hypothetical protein ACQKEG_06155, partial [Klebsiella quasipneumoniae]